MNKKVEIIKLQRKYTFSKYKRVDANNFKKKRKKGVYYSL